MKFKRMPALKPHMLQGNIAAIVCSLMKAGWARKQKTDFSQAFVQTEFFPCLHGRGQRAL